jgi:Holliday junction resolvase RusA-like endonuclease
MIALFVPGEPPSITAQQKGVNFKRRTFYTKSAIKAERRRITRAIRASIPARPIEGPVQCSIKIRYALTQKQAAHHVEYLSDEEFELPHWCKPDADNAIKLILDTLTSAGFWVDDGQVCDLNVHKRYGAEPGIHIRIKALAETI